MFELDATTTTFTTVRLLAARSDPASAHRRACRAAQIVLRHDPDAVIRHTRFFVVVTGWVTPQHLVTVLYYPRCTR